jgi:hypothetical protein
MNCRIINEVLSAASFTSIIDRILDNVLGTPNHKFY